MKLLQVNTVSSDGIIRRGAVRILIWKQGFSSPKNLFGSRLDGTPWPGKKQ